MPNAYTDAFLQYVKEKSTIGRDGHDRDAEYIPRCYLEEFWNLDKVTDILQTCNPPVFESPGEVVAGFIRVFSILVFIGCPQAISHFIRYKVDDQQLPHPNQPQCLPPGPYSTELFKKFHKYQWKFCPLEFKNDFMHKRMLSQEMVLPVTFEECLSQNAGDGDVATVWRVAIHPECNVNIPNGTVVFKVYQTEEASALFTTEANIYSTFHSEYYWDYIVKCYGSFTQGNKRTIILEHAPGGTLLDFFEKTRPPNTREELETLWKELFRLLHALHIIHEMPRPIDASTWVLSATHHDIQPVNILVFPQTPRSDYNIKFKLADFGTTHIRKKLSGTKDAQEGSNDGNRMYTAPESFPPHEIHDKVPKRVDPSVDVWALGAVFSEMLIWTIWGEAGREDYRQRRMSETAQISPIRGSGYDACFHDGNRALGAVETMHRDALEHTRRSDTLSPHISQLVLEHMLQNRREGRLDADTTFSKAEYKLELARKESQISSFPPSSSPTTFFASSPDALDSTDWTKNSRPDHRRSTLSPSFYLTSHTRSVSEKPTPGSYRRKTEMSGDTASETCDALQSWRPTSSPPKIHQSDVRRTKSATRGKRSALTMPGATNTRTGLLGLKSSSDNLQDLERASRNNHDQFDYQDFCHSPDSITTPSTSVNCVSSTTIEDGRVSTETTQVHDAEGSFSPSPHPTRSLEIRTITCGDVYNLLMKKDSKFLGHKIGQLRGSPSEVMTLPGISEALSRITSVGGREQVILVDDSKSMGYYKDKIVSTARVISYYVKRVDPNQMELYFASNVATPYVCATSSDVESAIRKHNFTMKTCAMDHCLGRILDYVWAKVVSSDKSFSIYVLTDAVWESHEPNVDKAIARFARNLEEKGLSPQRTMIQFIRFGDGLSEHSRLHHLDNGLVGKHGLGEEYDIVDTKHCNDHVPDILIGSILRFIDNKDTYPRRSP